MSRHVREYPSITRTHARSLRQQGYTYTEICSQLGLIPQGTLAGWFKDIQLDSQQQRRIHDKIIASAARGRPLARAAWAKKMQAWREMIEARAKPFGLLPYSHPIFGKLVCGVMYLCEGGKYPTSNHLIFGNTDPGMVKTFLTLLRQHYPIDERKLRARVMHRWDQDGTALIRHWSRVTQIPLSQFYRSYADARTKGTPTHKNNYRGVCCIQYGSTEIQYELQAIGEAIMRGEKPHEQ